MNIPPNINLHIILAVIIYCIFFLENFEVHEAKVFLQRHFSEAYYICHDSFAVVEVNLRQKGWLLF